MTEVSKKTCDYASLSATDIRVMAVTYMLETQLVGSNHLRDEPVMKPTVNFYTPGGSASGASQEQNKDLGGDSKTHLPVTAADLTLAGFYKPEDEDGEVSETTTTESEEGETEEERRKVIISI